MLHPCLPLPQTFQPVRLVWESLFLVESQPDDCSSELIPLTRRQPYNSEFPVRLYCRRGSGKTDEFTTLRWSADIHSLRPLPWMPSGNGSMTRTS